MYGLNFELFLLISCCILDEAAFSEVYSQYGGGFRIYNQYAVFVYSQLQAILPDNFLGSISEWDKYLQLDLSQPNLPFKTPDQFVLNSDYHQLVLSSKLPRPSKFIEQSIAFCKAFCRGLLSHPIVKSDLVKGLSCFDSATILDSEEERYIAAVEHLTTYFASKGWLSSADKAKAVSQYRAMVTKFRAGQVDRSRDWFLYLSSHYELQCRTALHQLFKLSCLCVPPKISYPPEFTVPLTELGPDEEVFRSCVAGVQISYNTVPNVTSLYKDPRSISRVFRLLGRGRELLADRKFSIWNFLRGAALRRGKWFAKFEAAYKSVVVSPSALHPTEDSDVASEPQTSSSSESPTARLNLGKATVAVAKLQDEVPCGSGGTKKKSAKLKKN